jgi:hypothetical protein
MLTGDLTSLVHGAPEVLIHSARRGAMRSVVEFHYPAAYVAATAVDDILGIKGATWFVELLRQIPRIEIDPDLLQEDWGVVIYAQRDGRRFWIGLSGFGNDEWVAHVHHDAWLQRYAAAGKAAYNELVRELERALRAAHATPMRWFDGFDGLKSRAAAESAFD